MRDMETYFFDPETNIIDKKLVLISDLQEQAKKEEKDNRVVNFIKERKAASLNDSTFHD
jgi:hypothetical protein